jgi:hypothetical protein
LLIAEDSPDQYEKKQADTPMAEAHGARAAAINRPEALSGRPHRRHVR